jgi:S1-C subfamily serine protease
MQQSQLALEEARVAVQRARMAPGMWSGSDWSSDGGPLATSSTGGMLVLGGLRVAPVSDGLSSYFGKGSENGLLVLDVNDSWMPLRAGDVILSVNGTPVRDGERTSLSLDSDRDNRFVVLRKGAKVTVDVKGH